MFFQIFAFNIFWFLVCRSDSASGGFIYPGGTDSLIDATNSNWTFASSNNWERISGVSSDSTTTMYKFRVKNNVDANTFTVLKFERSPPTKSVSNFKTYSDSMSSFQDLKFMMILEETGENNNWGMF